MKISKTGYKKDSKDKNEKSLIIPGGNITMENVPHAVFGVDNYGNQKLMMPGVSNYNFPGDYVTEFPIKQLGGNISRNSKLANKDINFQNWYLKNTLEGKKEISYNDQLDYDYYSFYKNNGNGNIKDHFPDTYKRVNHETFSDESIYSVPENKGGHWNENMFIKKYGGQMKKPNNKGFKSLPGEVQDFILNHMQQGGQPIMQSESFNKLSPTDIKQAWESNPDFKGKSYYDYNYFPTDTPKGMVNMPDASVIPQPMAKVEDPMKQEGFNGMMKPIVEKFNMGGGLNKFIKNFSKNSEAPQGESLDDYIKNNNTDFIEYLASNTRNNLLKDEVGNFQRQKNFFQSGGGFGSEPLDLKPISQGTPIETTGYVGNYTGTTPIFQNDPIVPKYVDDFKNNPGAKPMEEGNKQKGAGAAGMLGGLGSMISSMPGVIDPSSFIDAIKDSIDYQQKLKKDKWLDDQMRIENQVPKNYGSRGDYDINQGNFRPNQKTPVSYKFGGGYDLNNLPKAQWGAIIQMGLSAVEKGNEESKALNAQYFSDVEAKKQARNTANMQSLGAAANFSSNFQDPNQQMYPPQFPVQNTPMYKKGGGFKQNYLEGKSYDIDHNDLQELIKQGYEIEFLD